MRGTLQINGWNTKVIFPLGSAKPGRAMGFPQSARLCSLPTCTHTHICTHTHTQTRPPPSGPDTSASNSPSPSSPVAVTLEAMGSRCCSLHQAGSLSNPLEQRPCLLPRTSVSKQQTLLVLSHGDFRTTLVLWYYQPALQLLHLRSVGHPSLRRVPCPLPTPHHPFLLIPNAGLLVHPCCSPVPGENQEHSTLF